MPDDVPDGDDVSRHLFAPLMGSPGGELIWMNVFMFRTAHNYCESLVWRRHAATLADVHSLGCNKQRNDHAVGKNATYFGALTGNVGNLLSIRSKNGARFQITHVPVEGIHHLHISYHPDQPPTPNDKSELKKLIKDKFTDRSEHTCPENGAA